MEARDAPTTPEWGQSSTLSGGSHATATSSLLAHLPHATHPSPSLSSDTYSAMLAVHTTEMPHSGRNIAPFEAVACERLTEQFRSLSTAPSGSYSLEDALKDAAVTIRFNAKWFAEAPLSRLIETALDAAAASSGSGDLGAAVSLVDTVATYSLIPPQSLLRVVQLLTQTYYNASRANKTKKLADAVWKTMHRLLESHLGGQCVEALLQIVDCRDEAFLESRAGYAQVAGALMVISEKMLPREDVRHNVPTPALTQLLDSLWGAAVNGNDSLRELIMDIIAVVLGDQHAIKDLDEHSSWDVLLETLEPCVALTPHSQSAKAAVDGLMFCVTHLEIHQLTTVAHLFVDIGRPLTPELSSALLDPWSRLAPAKTWARGFEGLLKKLSASSQYTTELDSLITRSIDVFTRTSEHVPFTNYATFFQDCIQRPETTTEATTVLAMALVATFEHAVKTNFPHADINAIFENLCTTAQKSVETAEFLFQIRADVEGKLYVDISNISYDISFVPIQKWHDTILHVTKKLIEEDIHMTFVQGITPMLANHAMFEGRPDFIRKLRTLICFLLGEVDYSRNHSKDDAFPTKPSDTSTHDENRPAHYPIHFTRILAAIVTYHRHLSKQDLLAMVSIFLNIVGSAQDYLISIPCVHALTICCYELPDLMRSYMGDVIDKMSKVVTQRYLAIHVLLFLADLSRSPDLFRNFQAQDYKKIFGVCGNYLQFIRFRGVKAVTDRKETPSSEASTEAPDALPLYVYALTHHVMAFWYLALKADHRREVKQYITSCLRYTTPEGVEKIEDHGLVTIDLMDRVDAEEVKDEVYEEFEQPTDGRITTLHRLAGLLLITTETSLRKAKTIVTVRRPTGTTKRFITKDGNLEKPDGTPVSQQITMETGDDDCIFVYPEDDGGFMYGQIFIPSKTSRLGAPKTLTLPNNDAVNRNIQAIDRLAALDSHKAGLIYIGESQRTEDEILQNVQGSPDYVEFTRRLGSLRQLKDATFNTQGLDRASDADGQHAIVWTNEVTELVFHITTLMPNDADARLNTANKKRHIGNDFVNIIFNNSGSPFAFHTFPSAFNAVYIVITPSARTSFLQSRTVLDHPATETFYRVQVLTRPDYPAISSADSEKVVSGASLPSYVRNLALNECVFSLMWGGVRAEKGEYPSSWRSRLAEIRRLAERYG